MTERLQRPRRHGQRPPSRLMRSRMRQARFAVIRLLRRLRHANRLYPGEVVEMHRTVALCRRAIGQATGRSDATVPFASPSKPTSIDRRGESLAHIAD